MVEFITTGYELTTLKRLQNLLEFMWKTEGSLKRRTVMFSGTPWNFYKLTKDFLMNVLTIDVFSLIGMYPLILLCRRISVEWPTNFWILGHFFHCDLYPQFVLVYIWFSLICQGRLKLWMSDLRAFFLNLNQARI